jgi:regulator of sigma E protease
LIESPNFLWTILFFVLAISPLVFIHEMGHYLVGRWCGVKAEAFAIGFGRAIAKWTDKRGTVWQIGWLPLGGYVRFAGDMGVSSQSDPNWLKLPPQERNQTFQSKALWQRALIVLAGPLTNFLFAIIVFIALFGTIGEPRTPPVIAVIERGSAADAAGLKLGDTITSVDGQGIESFEDVARIVSIHPNEKMIIGVSRDGQGMTLAATPRVNIFKDRFGNEMRRGLLGIGPAKRINVKHPIAELPGAAVRFTINSVQTMATTLWQVVSGVRSIKELGGPVKIAQISGQQATLGPIDFLWLMTMISINLGFINLLPIPMLDGGHLLFYAIEAVRRKPVPAAAQEWAYRSGLFALLLFMVVVTVNDLAGLGLWRGIAGLIG